MNQTNDTILQAIDIVVNARLNAIKRDSTIKAQIVDVSQAEKGIYTIKYQNATFTAYNSSPAILYKPEESVYVSVINGDLGNDKYIIGKISSRNSTNEYIETVDINDYYQTGGPAFEILYNFTSNAINEVGIEIPAYTTTLINKKDNSLNLNSNCKSIFTNTLTDDSSLLPYSKEYGYIQISADFKYKPNEVTNDISKVGNYGLLLWFIDSNNQNIFSFFDTEIMYGTPYTPYEYIRRRATLTTPPGTIKSLKGVYLFSEGFTRTRTANEIKDFREIGVRNLTISFAKELDQNEPYIANILAPYGWSASEAHGLGKSLLLSGELKYKNKPSLDEYKCEWFEKNPNVDFNHNNYAASGGVGWEYKYTGQNYTILDQGFALDSVDWINKEIKLVITKDDIVRKDFVTIYKNFNQEFKYKIKATRNVQDEYVLQVVDENGVVLTTEYKYKWEYVDINGKTHALTSTINEVKENANNILTNRTYRCYLLTADNSIYAIVEYTINVDNESDEDFTVHFITESNGVFLYNEDGRINIESCLKQKDLSFTIPNNSWRSGSPQPYTYRWILNDYDENVQNYNATQLIADYTPNNSMVTYLKDSKLSGDSNTITSLHYKINQNFSYSKTKNNITLEISVNGVPYYFTFYFSFSKQGGMGTNGTNYHLVAEINDNSSKSLVYNSGWKVRVISYKLALYNNGIEEEFTNPKFEFLNCNISNNRKSLYLKEQSPINYKYDSTTKILTVQISETATANPIDYFCNIVKATVTAGNYTIMTYIPIDVLIGLNNNSNDYNFYHYPTIVYNPQGYNPQYYTGNLNDFWDSKDLQLPTSYSLMDSNQNNTIYKIRQFDSNDDDIKDAYALVTMPTYLQDKGYNALKITISANVYLIHPILAIINQYGIAGINEWVGNEITINENEGYIYSPQIAAGTKDNNKFTGVVMGNYVSKDPKNGQGLWGFQDGAASFGFNADGTAFIGKANSARLEFDGSTKGTIQSAGYAAGTKGLCLDFMTGTINAPSFMFKSATDKDESVFEFNLTADKSSKFLIKADGTSIFKATGAEQDENGIKKQVYELQSVNYDVNKTGLKIDLYDGSLISKDFTIKTGSNNAGGKFNFKIGDGNSSFIINALYTDDNGQKSSKSIFKATDNSYYLESINYSLDNNNTTAGLRIDLDKGSIASPKFFINNDGTASFKGSINVNNNFTVDGTTGNVTIGGNLTFAANSTITWSANALSSLDLTDYVKTGELDNKIKEYGYVTKTTVDGMLTGYATDGDITNKIESEFNKYGYLTTTGITSTTISSPHIIGGNVSAYHFNIMQSATEYADAFKVGELGYATGLTSIWDADTQNSHFTTTQGVLMGYTGAGATANYVICTSNGVRMQCGTTALYITNSGAFYRKQGQKEQEIGTAISGNFAVFG